MSSWNSVKRSSWIWLGLSQKQELDTEGKEKAQNFEWVQPSTSNHGDCKFLTYTAESKILTGIPLKGGGQNKSKAGHSLNFIPQTVSCTPTVLTICQSATDVFTLSSQWKPHASRIFRGHSKSQSLGLWRKGSYHKIAANIKLCLVCQHRDSDWRALELGSKDANQLSL